MAKKKKKKTSKNFFEGEVIKTADYNKAHGIAEEQPALRSAAAEILAPIKEHRLNEPDMTRCSKCGHKCHCDSKKPFVYRTWIGEVGTNPPETKEYKCNKCHHAEFVKDFPDNPMEDWMTVENIRNIDTPFNKLARRFLKDI